MFQSSPSLGAGSNEVGQPHKRIVHVFQSSPSLGAGSNVQFYADDSVYFVSILSQLRCWEQRNRTVRRGEHPRVSILSQLRCWEQREGGAATGIEKHVSILSQLRCWEQPFG